MSIQSCDERRQVQRRRLQLRCLHAYSTTSIYYNKLACITPSLIILETPSGTRQAPISLLPCRRTFTFTLAFSGPGIITRTRTRTRIWNRTTKHETRGRQLPTDTGDRHHYWETVLTYDTFSQSGYRKLHKVRSKEAGMKVTSQLNQFRQSSSIY